MAKENEEDEKKMIEYEKMVEGVFNDTGRLSRIIVNNRDNIKKYIEDEHLKKRTAAVLRKLRALNRKDKTLYFRAALGIKPRRRSKRKNERRENPIDDTSNTVAELRDIERNENQGTIPLLTQQETENEDIETGQPEPNEDDPENFVEVNGKTYNISRLTEREINEIRYPNEDNPEGELTTTRRVNEPPQRTIPSEPIRPIERPFERTELRLPNITNGIYSPYDYRTFGPNPMYNPYYGYPQQMSETGSEMMEYRMPTNEEQAQMQTEKERIQLQPLRPPLMPLTNMPRTYTNQVPQFLINQPGNIQRTYIQPSIVPYRNENLKRVNKTDIHTKRAPYQGSEIIDLTIEVIDVDDDEPLEKVNSPERKENTIPREEIKQEVKEEINEEVQESIDLSAEDN